MVRKVKRKKKSFRIKTAGTAQRKCKGRKERKREGYTERQVTVS